MYNAPANGLAEILNKRLGNLLKNIVVKNKRDCHEKIGEALWAYQTTFRTAPFYNKLIRSLCAKFCFKQHQSSMYNAPANGLAETLNKTLSNLLKKVVAKKKRDFHEKIGEALWAYQTTFRTAPFYNKLVRSLCAKFCFKQHKSSMYNAPTNGLAETLNKTLSNLLKKVVATNKRDCHEKIGDALWAYQTTFRTTTQATPYLLVYVVEAVLLLEQQILSLRIAIQGLMSEENAQLCLVDLEAFDEKRLQAQQKLEFYQAQLARPFNKKVHSSGRLSPSCSNTHIP
ncbi:uncharacterized protein [Nicotiana tomentosiformis]|uniref:uncharacterized protein n=1 Tax=Nicotiana tomentosiformis TaxID=4098 RepID=UPI00388C8907